MNLISKNRRILLGMVALLVVGLAIIGHKILTVEKLDPATVIQISGNDRRTLIVTSDGELWASGWSGKGELGIISRGEEPLKLADSVKQAITLPRSSAYVTEDGKLWVMGHGHDFDVFPAAVESNLGNHRSYILKTEVMSDVSKIAVGRAHVLILKNDGVLLGFGDNVFGQLGSEHLERLEIIAQGVVDMFAGEDRSYYLTHDGELFACGANGWGELGFGEYGILTTAGSNHRPIAHPAPQKVTDNVQSVFAGPKRTLILKNDGRLYQLGHNLDDIYGNGEGLSDEPVFIADQVKKMAIATIDAGELVLALKHDDSLYGFGAAVKELVPEADVVDGWVEILPSVGDFWSTPHLFVQTIDGKMRAAGSLVDYGSMPSGDLGQLVGWSWSGE